ncbi:MAG: sulfatase [Akkermansiaceae bacterium]|nr:sulfatase [Akkermansiaceae bacterium]
MLRSKRYFSFLAGCWLATILGGPGIVCAAPAESNGRKPNVVFILADDLGWQDVGFMGSRYFETPHLDALAKESLVLENTFMYPTCSPSRAAILTGRQSFRTGCYTVPALEKGNGNDNIFSKWTVGEEHPVFAQPLREAGYQLIHLGKWHIVGPYPGQETGFPFKKKLNQPNNGDFSWLESHRTPAIQKYYPTGRGFHENVGGTWWGDPSRGYAKGYNAPGGGYVAPFKNPFIKDKPGDSWLTDRLTDDAIDFIKRHKDGPFFVNLHYYAPHRPSVARNQELLAHFMKKKGDSSTGQGMGPAKKKKEIAAYATMIKSIDDNVKRILDYLDEAGLRENTVVIFTSDNGFNGLQSRNTRLRGAKGNVYDGGLRVPALVNWPQQVAAGRNNTPVQGLDLFPTFLELAGIRDYTGTLDGTSWLPLMKGEGLKDRAIFWHVASTYKDPPCSIIRKGKWKLIQFLKHGKIELYNTEQDLKESQDLAKSHPEIAKQLENELIAWRRQHKVPLPPSSSLKN